MTRSGTKLSDAESRREQLIKSAIHVFGRAGYRGTSVAEVAAHAQLSPAYVFKLFSTKEALFVAALERCYAAIHEVITEAAAAVDSSAPEAILSAMGAAYAQLIARRELLLLQVHALAATDIELVAETVRRGLAMVTTLVKERSQASDEDVQQFMARGQLCQLIVTAGLDNIDAPWADLLQRGIRHPGTMTKQSPRRGRRRTAE
ncbi:MAG: TetR/AcrR family transcriptional regulator [Proteobacteria bacterium]|nr:TetR/AcrR family transcriptional regulator [Pseudomonadota bacterium]